MFSPNFAQHATDLPILKVSYYYNALHNVNATDGGTEGIAKILRTKTVVKNIAKRAVTAYPVMDVRS